MDRIEDPRVRFYLEHQALIDTWAAVRKDLAAMAHDFYLSIGERLEDRAPGLGPDIQVSVSDTAYSRVGYRRVGWPLDAADQPVVGIYLEWKKGTTTFADGPRYVGVRIDLNDPSGDLLRETVFARIKGSQAKAEFPKTTPWWPAHTEIKPSTEAGYWDDLTPYAESIMELIESAWIHFSPAVDIAVSTAQS